MTYDRIVLGAGMSGLAYAWWATLRGESVLLLEASDRAGGVVRTDTIGGYRVERAASTIPSTATHLKALIASLPSPPELVPAPTSANRQFLVGPTGLEALPRSPPSLVSSGALPAGAKVRLLWELLLSPRRTSESETLQQFVRRRFGRTVADRFLRPFTNGVYGASPDRLGAADAFPTLAAWERRHGGVLRAMFSRPKGGSKREVLVPAGGMESIVRAVAAALGDRLRLGTSARLLARDRERSLPAVTTADGATFEAREVALAIPAGRQAELLEDVAPHAAEVLSAVRYAPIAVAAVGVPPGGSPPVPEGFGFLRGRGGRTRILGATFLSCLAPAAAPPGHRLLQAYIGGTEDPTALDLDDGLLRDVVLRDLGRALQGPVKPDLVETWRHPRAIPVFAPGHRGRMAALSAALAPHGIRLLGSHVTGVGLDRCASAGAPSRVPVPEGLALG